MEKRYIIGLDEGTTSCRCVVYDTKLNKIISSIGKKFTQYFPKPSWVDTVKTYIGNDKIPKKPK